jgi:hypothetical protein
LWIPSSPACPFCSQAGRTLVEEVTDAEFVMYGSFKNPRAGDGDNPDQTDFKIDSIIKKNEAIGDKKQITVDKYIRESPSDKRWLVFGSMFKGKIDLYMAQLVNADSGIDKYLTQALAYQDRKKDPAKRLRFFFDYLDNAEAEIANDALKEWSLADYKDYRDIAKKLPADKLAKWLADPNTAQHRIGLYASLLGHCGTKENIPLLKGMLDDPTSRAGSGLDGILAGYVLLDPKDGWKAVDAFLATPSYSFNVRNAALRSARFFWDNRLDVVDKDTITTSVCNLLDESDIADFAINDLLRHGEWSPLERILALDTKPSHNIAIIHRAILRYALCVPEDKDPKKLAKTFVDKIREKDPERVQAAEDLLRLEKLAK